MNKQISNTEVAALDKLRHDASLGKRRLAKAVPGLTDGRAQRILQKFRSGYYDTIINDKQESSPREIGVRGAISVNAFIEKHDLRLRLRSAIETELIDVVVPDQDLRAHLGINPQVWTKIRESSEFAVYHKEIRGKQYWGQPSTLEQIVASLDYI